MTSPARRLIRVAPAIAASALIAGAVFATPFGAAATTPPPTPSTSVPAPAPTTATDDSSTPVALFLAAAGTGVVAPGADLTVTVEVTGSSSGGTISLALDDSALRSSSSLTSWLDGGEGGSLVTVATAPAPTGGGTVSITVPAVQLPAGLGGAHGLQATLDGAGATPVTARGTVVVDDGISSRADVTVIAPITSVASATGLIQPAALEAFTNDTGVLTRELDSVIGRPVTIAVDPRIIVSIRALGSTAPESAVAWLQRLESASNPVIPLSYGDSDLSGERQAGASSALQPTSFDYALDPADFTDVEPLIEPTATPASPTPTASPTPAAPSVPTLEQLTDWDYASTTIAWPRAGSVTAADLPFFAASGYSASIIDSQQLTPASGDAGEALQAVATTGSQTVFAADHAVSQAVQDAVAASTDTSRGQAVGELSAALALAAETGGGTPENPTPVLAVLDRAAMNLNSIDQVVSTVQALPWSAPGSLSELLQIAPTQTVSLVDAPQPDERVTRIANLLLGGQQIDSYSSVLSNPQLLSGRHRADLLTLLSNAWVANEGGWSVATDAFNEETATTLTSVQIVEGSDINLLSSSAPLPLTISNELPYPVSVIVHVTASNGRLLIDQNDVGVVVEANSRKSAQIPVTAVANGSVVLSFQLTSASGVLIANPSPVAVNVSADWETWGTVIFVVALVLLFGGGLARNILRRRKERRAAPDAAVAPPAPPAPEVTS
ncbi:DUF6049 family protein [Herbiconiux sp. VKM Ac-2851]|uniref:DUF6049 family protein n=1 Tax=Herbiconiux sp. VKM Ac-2851 TaxID=2739025 RepID=UPI001566EA94|nr:DUF6049 family protein [Herbiconiux sp. VKM Ac-2851]NQX34839.1 hypothetical protein [Herbiconiux sp. VKM Ac-2851]